MYINYQVVDWRNGWNEIVVIDFCINVFSGDFVVVVCVEKVNISILEYINSCIIDIKVSKYQCK